MRPLTYRCDQRWSDLTPTNGGRRHCGACGNDAHDLFGMTRREATRFREDNPGACIRVRVRAGTEELLFVPEPPSRKLALPVVVAASLALGCAEEEPLARIAPEALVTEADDSPPLEPLAPDRLASPVDAPPTEAIEPSDAARGEEREATPAPARQSARAETARPHPRSNRHHATRRDEERTASEHAAAHAFPARVMPSTLDAPQPVRHPREISTEMMGF